MAITTLASFRAYIRRSLGGGNPGDLTSDRPTINVELSQAQLNQCIEDTVETVQRYLYGEGEYEDYVALSLIPGISAYSLSGTDIEDVVEFNIGYGTANGINTLFTPANMVLGSNLQYIFQGGGLALAGYEVAMNYLEMIEDMFTVKFRVDYRERQNLLVVNPTPTTAMVGLLKVYKREAAENLYSHPLVKKIAVAKAKMIWGIALSKLGDMQLPGGGSYKDFANRIWQEGHEDEKEYIKQLKPFDGESEPVGFMIG